MTRKWSDYFVGKCAHVENKGNVCSPNTCPRSGNEYDWIALVDDEDYDCSYKRSPSYKPRNNSLHSKEKEVEE